MTATSATDSPGESVLAGVAAWARVPASVGAAARGVDSRLGSRRRRRSDDFRPRPRPAPRAWPIRPGARFRSRRCISTRSPAAPASGINSRGRAGRRAPRKSRACRPGPSSRGVTHETIASPAGKTAVCGSTRRSLGARRLAILRPELDREVGGARPVLVPAVDEPIGEEPKRVNVSPSRVHSEPVSSNTRKPWLSPATRAATTSGIDRHLLPAVAIGRRRVGHPPGRAAVAEDDVAEVSAADRPGKIRVPPMAERRRRRGWIA